MSVTGSATFTVNENDFINGIGTKEQDPSSNVQKVQIGNGGQFVPIENVPTQIIDFNDKQSNTNYPVNFKLSGLPETQDSGNYKTIVTYTVAVNS